MMYVLFLLINLLPNVRSACTPIPEVTGDDFEFDGGAAWWTDCIRSGGQNEESSATQTTFPPIPAGTASFNFEWDYLMGYCATKGTVTAPIVKLILGDDPDMPIWTSSIDLATQDYPYDLACDGGHDNFSPKKSVSVDISQLSGSVTLQWKFTTADRNIHIRPTSMMFCDSAGPDDTGGLGGGSIFVILVVCVLFSYFLFGFLYNKLYKKTDGIKESIPQVEFWSNLPGLVKQGCEYTVARIKLTFQGKGEYEEL